MPTKRKPVELTASAKTKLEKAKKLTERKKKAGSLGNIRKTKTTKQSRLNDIMGKIKTSRGKKN